MKSEVVPCYECHQRYCWFLISVLGDRDSLSQTTISQSVTPPVPFPWPLCLYRLESPVFFFVSPGKRDELLSGSAKIARQSAPDSKKHQASEKME